MSSPSIYTGTIEFTKPKHLSDKEFDNALLEFSLTCEKMGQFDFRDKSGERVRFTATQPEHFVTYECPNDAEQALTQGLFNFIAIHVKKAELFTGVEFHCKGEFESWESKDCKPYFDNINLKCVKIVRKSDPNNWDKVDWQVLNLSTNNEVKYSWSKKTHKLRVKDRNGEHTYQTGF